METMRARMLTMTLTFAMIAAVPRPAWASRESNALCDRGASEIFNLDRDRAIVTFREAIALDPTDARAYRGLASALWLSITFRRGNMTVDDYLGRVNKPATQAPAPPPEVAAAFQDAVDHAQRLARQQIAANPSAADGHYQLGAVVGLKASYTATVDGSAAGAFRAAREAYDEHERVLQLDPRRKDAGLVVGMYRYLVSTLAMPLRWVAYVAGFGGGRERGVQLVEDAAAYAGDNQTDARLGLLLLYNREKRFDDALKQLTTLRERYPRNRLLWLETGATSLRAGRAEAADQILEEGFAKFTSDARPRMFGEEALWYLKRGTARAWSGKPGADDDLTKAISTEGRTWVKGRAHLELGRSALATGNKARAKTELETAIALCEGDNDPAFAEEARRLLK